MKRGSTFFLRAVIFLIGLAVLAICLFALPPVIMSEITSGDFDYGPILIGLYVPAVPFFFALYQSLRLLRYIDKNDAFTPASVRAFKYIKLCALLISGIFIAGSPYLLKVADADDAPGVLGIGLIIAFASFVIATFAAVLQKLVQNAVDIKSENDLTV